MGGAAAIGTTPGLLEPVVPDMDGGDSEAVLAAVRASIALDGACGTEFLREDFLEPREEPTATLLALLRFRFLITSVFKDSGRTTPWSFRNNPQALQSG